ncbi:peptide chain release factor 2 [bacterium]|nr:peptide chain release factor 2 [bacterium]
MQELKDSLNLAKEEIAKGLKTVNPEELKHRVVQLGQLMSEPNFWDDQEKAQSISQEVAALNQIIEDWQTVQRDCDELLGLVEITNAEENPKEAQELHQMVAKFDARWKDLLTKSFLSGPYDKNDVILSIHAGTGGKDAMDFAEMLLRMYLRYAEERGFKAEILDKSEGEEVGLKSATITIKGYLAYGYLKSENGVHRLVRLSPFNSKHTRETSFAMVEVLPELKLEESPEIDHDDLRIDTYRSSSAGGQSVNKTDSAVRITHIPTNIVVQCQNERSQLQNKEQAMKILLAKLNDLRIKEAAEKIEDIRGGRVEIKWGSQIRSYVLHPYTMVKDHRTKYETSKVEEVLDGDIEGFIRSYLEMKFKAPKADLS